MEFQILLDFVAVSAAAFLGGALAHLLKIPTIVGYLFAGMIAGPGALGLVDNRHLTLLAEIGAGMLLFEAGIEFRVKEMLQKWRILVFGGGFQVILCAVVVFLICKAAEPDSLRQAIFLGLLVSISSTAEAVKLLDSRGEKGTLLAKFTIGILVLQDFLVIPYSLVTNVLGGGTDATSIWPALKGFLPLLVVLPGLVLVSRFVLARIYSWALNHNARELFRAILVVMMASAFYFSHLAGLSIALGGFIAGVSVSAHRDSRHILNESGWAKDIFAYMFFISIGMLVDYHVVLDQLPLILCLLGAVIAIKVVSTAIPLAMMGLPFRLAIGVGFLLAQVGEFSFILASSGRQSGLLSEEMFRLFVALSVLTMMVNPLLVSVIRPLARVLGDRRLVVVQDTGLERDLKHEDPLPPTIDGHTVIVGWGSVAKVLAPGLATLLDKEESLSKPGKVVVIDIEPEHVAEARDAGLLACQGSCEHETVLEKARIKGAGLFVIASGDIFSKIEAVRLARRLSPSLQIVARAASRPEEERLYAAGANFVVTDETAASHEVVDVASRLANVSAEVRESLLTNQLLLGQR